MNNPLEDIDPDLHVYNSSTECPCFLPSEFNSQSPFDSRLSLIQFNARSLQKIFENISQFLSMLHHSFDFIAISETWISGPPLIPFSLDGYTMLNADRSHGRGGDVALFVKTGVLYNLRTDIVESLDSDINYEYLFIDFVDQFQKKILLV